MKGKSTMTALTDEPITASMQQATPGVCQSCGGNACAQLAFDGRLKKRTTTSTLRS